MKFELGRLFATPGVVGGIPDDELKEAVERHRRGDWGAPEDVDVLANERAVRDGDRLLSVYRSKSGIVFWLITEADRTSTTALLPSEY